MLSSLLGLVATSTCAGCRGEGGPLCASCAALLRGPAYDAPVSPRPPGLPAVLAVAAYDGPVREAVVAFKDHGRWSLRTHLGDALARSVAAALLLAPDQRRTVLVPAPGSPGSAGERDGDHVRELAHRAAQVLRREGVRVSVVPALTSVRRRRDQVGLDRAARAANLAASMAPTDRGAAPPARRARRARRRRGHHRCDPRGGGPRAAGVRGRTGGRGRRGGHHPIGSPQRRAHLAVFGLGWVCGTRPGPWLRP